LALESRAPRQGFSTAAILAVMVGVASGGCGGIAAPLTGEGGTCSFDAQCQTGYCQSSLCAALPGNPPTAGRVCDDNASCRGLICDAQARRCVACGSGDRPACPGPGDAGPDALPPIDGPAPDLAGDAGGGGPDGEREDGPQSEPPPDAGQADAADGGVLDAAADVTDGSVADAADGIDLVVVPDLISVTVDLYVSGAVGSDSNPGTQLLPLRSIGQALINGTQLLAMARVPVTVHVAGAHYPEKVTLVQGISLLGGYDCSAQPCSWSRNPAQFDTAILDQDFEGVLSPSGIDRATLFDGFRVVGMGGAPAADPGSAAMTILSSAPTVTGNTLAAGTVTGGSTTPAKHSVGLAILGTIGGAGPLVSGNTITGGQSPDSSTGVFLRGTTGSGGGPAATLLGNTIRAGSARTAVGVRATGTILGTLVSGNGISAGNATTGEAWGIQVGGAMTIDSNRINVPNGTNSAGSCAQPPQTGWCGGIASESSTSVITNNVVFGISSVRSTAVRLGEFEVPAGTVVLNSNYLDGGGLSPTTQLAGVSTAVVVAIGSCGNCGLRGKVGRIRNNILAGGLNQDRFGIYEDGPTGKTTHPEALEACDFDVPPATGAISSLYRSWDGTTGTRAIDITVVNGFTFATGLVPSFAADCGIDPVSFTLPQGSACIDAGTANEAPFLDRSGDARPQGQGFDVGPDEAG
jgi:hypothetical protein